AAKKPLHQIVAPIEFHYLDISGVNGVYGQIESDLIETERTISSTKKQGGSAELGAGPATLKGEMTKDNQETKKYERSDASTERKCIQVMNFILKSGAAHYYTTIQDFY